MDFSKYVEAQLYAVGINDNSPNFRPSTWVKEGETRQEDFGEVIEGIKVKDKMSPDRDMNHVYPAFRAKVEIVLKGMEEWCKAHRPTLTPMFGEGFRSTARQQELYAQGRTKPGNKVTNADGVRNPSKHQSGLAMDLWVKRNGKIVWDAPKEFWDYYGHLCRANGLEWGGDWKGIVDQPHCQWPSSDKDTYVKAKTWLKSNGLL